jgi:hypothetical protein
MRNLKQGHVLSLVLLLRSSAVGRSEHAVETNGHAAVLPLVNRNDGLTDLRGKPLTEVTAVAFSLYQSQEAATPLWTEVQKVQTQALVRRPPIQVWSKSSKVMTVLICRFRP